MLNYQFSYQKVKPQVTGIKLKSLCYFIPTDQLHWASDLLGYWFFWHSSFLGFSTEKLCKDCFCAEKMKKKITAKNNFSIWVNPILLTQLQENCVCYFSYLILHKWEATAEESIGETSERSKAIDQCYTSSYRMTRGSIKNGWKRKKEILK